MPKLIMRNPNHAPCHPSALAQTTESLLMSQEKHCICMPQNKNEEAEKQQILYLWKAWFDTLFISEST